MAVMPRHHLRYLGTVMPLYHMRIGCLVAVAFAFAGRCTGLDVAFVCQGPTGLRGGFRKLDRFQTKNPCPLQTPLSSRRTLLAQPGTKMSLDVSMFGDAQLLVHAAGAAHEAGKEIEKIDFTNPVLKALLGTPSGWALLLTGVLILIGQSFEAFKHYLEHNLPKTMKPVIQGIFTELATLGVVGLLVGLLRVPGEDSWLSALSAKFLGEPELLYEEFEVLHQRLFAVTVTFFFSCTALLFIISSRYNEWASSYSQELLALFGPDSGQLPKNKHTGTQACAPSYDALYQMSETKQRDDPLLLLRQEFFMNTLDRRAEFLRFRKRFIMKARRDKNWNLPDDFLFWDYMSIVAAKSLREMVCIEPLEIFGLWGMCVAAFLFIGTDAVMNPWMDANAVFFGLSQAGLGVWVTWNYYKMAFVKNMLRPTMSLKAGKSRLLPPPYKLLGGACQDKYNPNSFAILERPWAAPASNDHEKLFGFLGKNGRDFYLSSQKLSLFACVVSLVTGVSYSFSDLASINPVLALLSVLPAFAGIYLAPYTFVMYSFNTATEELMCDQALEEVMELQRRALFCLTLRILGQFNIVLNTPIELWEQSCNRTRRQVEELWEELLVNENPRAILDLKGLFDGQDLDRSGELSSREIREITEQLGYNLSDEQFAGFFRSMDTDGSGSVDFKEFATVMFSDVWTYSTTPKGSRDKKDHFASIACAAFDFFDRDNSGTIEETEFVERLRLFSLDEALSSQLFYDIAQAEGASHIDRKQFDDYCYRVEASKLA